QPGLKEMVLYLYKNGVNIGGKAAYTASSRKDMEFAIEELGLDVRRYPELLEHFIKAEDLPKRSRAAIVRYLIKKGIKVTDHHRTIASKYDISL
ncbi:MAG: hypothetical protein AB1540_07525, partial [Bdellovibrionota bacterium]